MSRKILFVVNNYRFFMSHRLEIGKAALASGYQVWLAAPRDDEAIRELEEMGFNVSAINVSQQDHGVIGQTKFLHSVYKLCSQIDPDICHLITLKTFLVGGLAAKLAKVPQRIGSVSGLGFFFISKRLIDRVKRVLFRPLFMLTMSGCSVRVIFQNDDDRELLSAYAQIKKEQTLMIAGSGVDLNKFSFTAEPEMPLRFLLPGRMLKDKGVEEFIRASYILKKNYKDTEFLMAGLPDDTNPVSFSSAELDDLKKDAVVQWLGHCDEMQELFAAVHVVVLPSYREGFPKVLIEAAASGRAVVTTDVPGCRHAVESGKTGILVPVRNAIALAEAMETLINAPEKRLAMGRRGRVLAETLYSVDSVVKKHLHLYSELVPG